MKLSKTIFALLLTFAAFTCLKSEILDIFRMDEIHPYIQPNTFIIFDIDNTLLEPVQELGTDQWFYSQLQKYVKQEMPFEKALNQALREWQAIQLLTKVKIVENQTEEIILKIQEEGFHAIGLTTRGFELSSCTNQQLKSLNIDFSLSSPLKTDSFFSLNKLVLFHEGTLFTNGTHKGEAFLKFIEIAGVRPEHVLFINDKASHIKEIEESCFRQNIAFTGLRYGFLDNKVKNFRQEVAEIQFKNFEKILNDEEALNLLNGQTCCF